jgi:hypothetical protein
MAGEDGGLTGTGGGRLARAAPKRMPLPSPDELPLPRLALQQFLEGSTTRLLQSHLSVAPAILLLQRGAKRVGAVPA